MICTLLLLLLLETFFYLILTFTDQPEHLPNVRDKVAQTLQRITKAMHL
jgi:hypothetical protein